MIWSSQTIQIKNVVYLRIKNKEIVCPLLIRSRNARTHSLLSDGHLIRGTRPGITRRQAVEHFLFKPAEGIWQGSKAGRRQAWLDTRLPASDSTAVQYEIQEGLHEHTVRVKPRTRKVFWKQDQHTKSIMFQNVTNRLLGINLVRK